MWARCQHSGWSKTDPRYWQASKYPLETQFTQTLHHFFNLIYVQSSSQVNSNLCNPELHHRVTLQLHRKRLKIVFPLMRVRGESSYWSALSQEKSIKSTHSIRDFISHPASVKVKCWRISPGSIIVCNFALVVVHHHCCTMLTYPEVTYEMPQEAPGTLQLLFDVFRTHTTYASGWL